MDSAEDFESGCVEGDELGLDSVLCERFERRGVPVVELAKEDSLDAEVDDGLGARRAWERSDGESLDFISRAETESVSFGVDDMF
jgi:hypothetical protein